MSVPMTTNSEESPRRSPAGSGRRSCTSAGAPVRALSRERAGDGLRRRRAQGLGHEDAVARGPGDEHPVHVGVEQRRARGPLVGVAAHVEAAGDGGVERALRPRRLRRRPDEADVDAPGARRVEGGDVERGEAEQQHEAGEDDAGRRAGVAADRGRAIMCSHGRGRCAPAPCARRYRACDRRCAGGSRSCAG